MNPKEQLNLLLKKKSFHEHQLEITEAQIAAVRPLVHGEKKDPVLRVVPKAERKPTRHGIGEAIIAAVKSIPPGTSFTTAELMGYPTFSKFGPMRSSVVIGPLNRMVQSGHLAKKKVANETGKWKGLICVYTKLDK